MRGAVESFLFTYTAKFCGNNGHVQNKQFQRSKILQTSFAPQSQFDQLLHQMLVRNHIVTGNGPAAVNIARERLETLVVA